MSVATKVISEYGFNTMEARLCPECGDEPRVVIITGNDHGEFGAFQVECPHCHLSTAEVLLFKFNADGKLRHCDPEARDKAEGLWDDICNQEQEAADLD